MILIRADHDEGTHYLYKACDPLISYAEKKGFKVVKVEGDDINLECLEKRVNKSKPKMIFFNGHGSRSGICDNDKNEFVNTRHSNVFKNTITYTRACNCLVELGKSAVKKGCKAFIGYKRNFWLPKLNAYTSRPLKDPVAKPVIESSNAIIKCIISGNTVQDAIDESRNISRQYIKDLIYANDPYKEASLPALVNNMSALDSHGDVKATVD